MNKEREHKSRGREREEERGWFTASSEEEEVNRIYLRCGGTLGIAVTVLEHSDHGNHYTRSRVGKHKNVSQEIREQAVANHLKRLNNPQADSKDTA